jgi:hypothetical protein
VGRTVLLEEVRPDGVSRQLASDVAGPNTQPRNSVRCGQDRKMSLQSVHKGLQSGVYEVLAKVDDSTLGPGKIIDLWLHV